MRQGPGTVQQEGLVGGGMMVGQRVGCKAMLENAAHQLEWKAKRLRIMAEVIGDVIDSGKVNEDELFVVCIDLVRGASHV